MGIPSDGIKGMGKIVVTVMLTVAMLESYTPSLAVKVKESGPE